MERGEAPAVAVELLAVEDLRLSLHLDAASLAEFVELGLVHPAAGPGGALRVTLVEAERLARAARLARELELHAAGAALLVELLDERDRLLRRLDALECLLRPVP